MLKSTRLRYLSAKTPEEISISISRLPFKVELKSLQFNGSRWVVWFVLPEEEGIDFVNLDL